MSWTAFALAASVLWALVAVIDKFITDKEVDDPVVDGSVNMIGIFSTLLVASLLLGSVNFSPRVIIFSLLAAFLYLGAMIVYFKGIQAESISRFEPVMSMDAVFITVISAILLNEVFTLPVYAGIVTTIAGAFLISLEDPVKSLKKFKSKKAILLALATAFLFAIREVILKHALSGISIWGVTLWMSIGGLGLSTALLFYKKVEVDVQYSAGIRNLGLSGILTAVGFIFFIKAISLGPVSLSSTVTKSRYLLIFGISFLSTRYHPEIIHEEMNRETILQKMLGIILIIAGISLVTL